MAKDKSLALKLLIDKQSNHLITYEFISSKSGYSKRQLIRLSSLLNEKDSSSVLQHGNVGKEPVNKASDCEIDFFINMKNKYPKITISQFRDIFIEDVLLNPEMATVVESCNLQNRSKTWFRNLFNSHNWKSPKIKKTFKKRWQSCSSITRTITSKRPNDTNRWHSI